MLVHPSINWCVGLKSITIVRWKAASRVLTAPSPPTLSAHKSLACRPCFSAPFRSKVTALDLLHHRILYSFVLLSRALCSFTSNLAIVILLDQMKMHLLILEFVALYIRGVQLVSLIVLSIGSPNQCFVNKVVRYMGLGYPHRPCIWPNNGRRPRTKPARTRRDHQNLEITTYRRYLLPS